MMLSVHVSLTALRYSDGREKMLFLLVIQLHCKDLIKQALGKSDQEYLFPGHNLAEQIYCLPVLMPMTVY